MNKPMKNRREFLATVGTAGAASIVAGTAGAVASLAAEGKEKLAIDGGTPVRKTPLRYQPYGPQFYNEVEKREILEVLESRKPFRWWKSGSKVLQFEQAYAAHIGVKYAIGVTSGTTALSAALAALEIGPGDEVILPAWTWYADYDTIVLAGALPVFAEVDSSLNIDPEDIEARITPRTKAIIAVSLQGCPADMDPILEIARKHKLRVLEDFSQCVGGRYRGKYLGSMGDIGISSFQQSKTITAGEGGAVVTNDPKLFERAVRAHDVGSLRSPYKEELGGGRAPGLRRVQLPHERIHRRDPQGAGAGPRDHLQGRSEQRPEGPRGHRRPAGTENAEDAGPGGGFGRDRLPGPRHPRAARPVPAGDAGRGNRRLAAGRLGDPADRRADRKQGHRPPRLAFLQHAARQGHPLRRGMLPKNDRHHRALGGVIMDPNFTDDDVKDIIAAIRKVYMAMHTA